MITLNLYGELKHRPSSNEKSYDVLNAAGSSLEKVIFARVYLVNFGDFDKMNSVYASYFAKDRLPARTCIGVTGLAVGASVEIDFIAAC